MEDSESLVVQLCLAEESDTLTSQVRVTVTSIPITATGTLLSKHSYKDTGCPLLYNYVAHSIE